MYDREVRMPMNGADIYQKQRQAMLERELEDTAMQFALEKGERYYMLLPRRYLFFRGIRIMLMFFVCIMACYNVLTISTPPLFFLSFKKFWEYCRYLSTMNVSAKKLRIFLVLWLLICIGINIVFWNWLETIW